MIIKPMTSLTTLQLSPKKNMMSKLFCIIQCLLFFYSAECANNETDFRALSEFKKSIDTDPYGSLSSWNQTVHFCNWQGILCSQRHQNRVQSINLTSRGLIGSLSPYLGNLSFLRSINLQNNTFYGHIPEEIGRLRRLEFVTFSNNSLSGEIPRNISQCTRIYHLNLIHNDLTGTIIPEIGSLHNLRALGLSVNRLSGTIPPFIGNLTRLAVLSLGNCGMQGEIPESLVQLKMLTFLTLVENNLTGRIPLGLFNISTMLFFAMRSNNLHGTIPLDIGLTFPRLNYLDLAENQFTGKIPFSVSNLSFLERINLSSNNFTGQILIDFARLPALTYFILDSNPLGGDLRFMSSMINCTRLTTLGLGYNLLSGSLPVSIANLSSRLNFLSLDENMLHGRIPSGLGSLIGLTILTLQNNDLDGPIPSTIGNLINLHELNLGGNRLTSEIPFSLGNLTSLNDLRLGDNNLNGFIPGSLSNCTNLLTLDISDNNLIGTIPPDVVSLSSLSIYFSLSNNALTGSIPSEIGSLTHLGILDLSHNRLSGLVPLSLSSCLGLQIIDISSNSLHGEVPIALATLRGMQYLDLSQNNFSGQIPRFLSRLDLEYLNMSFNRLEGEIPNLGVFLNESAISLEGNIDLCGGIPSLRFPPCPFESSKRHHFPKIFKIFIPLVSAMLIIFSACFCVFIYKRRKFRYSQSSMVPLGDNYLRVSYADLLKSTDGFSKDNLLGAGKFGSVFKGLIGTEQTVIAVKVLHLNVKGASKSFMSECNVLRSIRHRNLVKILSVCSSTDYKGNDFKALVYEFMSNGNLDEWLHPKPDVESRSLSFRERLHIASDIASAIEYLHCGTDSTIVHGDLKPSNILLDGEMTAHVGDFGLAKVVSNIFSIRGSGSIGIQGTIGYIPPEYGMSDMVSTEGDVYSYGIMLLEIVTGRRPTDQEFNDSSSLRDLVKNALPNQGLEIVDAVTLPDCSQEKKSKTVNCMVSLLEIGLACSKELPRDRMSMTSVVNELRKIISMAD